MELFFGVSIFILFRSRDCGLLHERLYVFGEDFPVTALLLHGKRVYNLITQIKHFISVFSSSILYKIESTEAMPEIEKECMSKLPWLVFEYS